MRQLRDDTHLILDGEVRVYRRERSRRWQAAFNIDGHTIRVSTGKRDLAEAKEYARDTYLEYKFRHKNDLPIVTKKFSDVARLAIVDMRKQLDAGLGKKVYADYCVCIERYLIPFFGAQYAYSGVIRPVFPKVSGHPFRFYPATDSGASGHPVM